MSNSKVTVVVPVYNVKKYLNRCIDSLLNQNYSEYKILLIDDGSTDGSNIICDDYQKKYPEIISCIHKSNGGLSSARNCGIENTHTPYIMFVDSDDWVDFDFVSFAVGLIEEYNTRIACFRYYISDDNKSILPKNGWYNKDAIYLGKIDALKLLFEDIKIESHAWDKIYETSLFNDIKFPNSKNYEDICIMHDLFDKCNGIIYSNQAKYHYYSREDSIARRYTSKNVIDYFNALFIRKDFCKKKYPKLISILNTKIMELYLSYYPKKILNRKFFNKFLKDNIQQILDFKVSHVDFTSNKYKYMYKVMSISKILYKVVYRLSLKVNKQHFKWLKNFLSNNHDFKNSTRKKLLECNNVIIGIPEYDNLGDIAIGYAEKCFIDKYGENNLFITEKDFLKNTNYIKKYLNKNATIFIQGGGNFGNVYMDQENIRRKILKKFITNKLVMFPSTFYLKDYKNDIKKYSRLYNRNASRLTIFCRELNSYNLVKEWYKGKVYATPDIVLSLSSTIYKFDNIRSGVGICIRSDIESAISKDQLSQVEKMLSTTNEKVYHFDTCIGGTIYYGIQENTLKMILNDISKYKLVITDKLHGMIFCYLTGTPCIVFDNYNKKISGVYKWIENVNFIRLIEKDQFFEKDLYQILTSVDVKYDDLISKFDLVKQHVIRK